MNGMTLSAIVGGLAMAAAAFFLLTSRKAAPATAGAKDAKAPAPAQKGGALLWLLGGGVALGLTGFAGYQTFVKNKQEAEPQYPPEMMRAMAARQSPGATKMDPSQMTPEQLEMMRRQHAQAGINSESGMSEAPAGEGQPEAQAEPQGPDPLADALQVARSNPTDAEAQAYVVHELLRAQRFEEAEEFNIAALKAKPDHAESKVHEAVIDGLKMDPKAALADLKKLGGSDRVGREAWLYRGAIAMQLNEREIAKESFEEFVKVAPKEEQPKMLGHVLTALGSSLGDPMPAMPAQKAEQKAAKN